MAENFDTRKRELKVALAAAEAVGDDETAGSLRKDIAKLDRDRLRAIQRVAAASERAAATEKTATPAGRTADKREKAAE